VGSVGDLQEVAGPVPLTVRLAQPQDLPEILRLQSVNLPENISAEEYAEQGFVTVHHTLDILQTMHALAPSVVAFSGAQLAGYALVMPVSCGPLIPVLQPMIASFDRLSFKGRALSEQRYYVMGQVCVARPFRGQGVFDALYAGHAREYGGTYDCTVTEISLKNPRSMRAHQRVGFGEIQRQRDEHGEWSIVAWDFGRA
jgi:GNAT superfamily N-acetyltransferase